MAFYVDLTPGYLDRLADDIRVRVPRADMPVEDTVKLFRIYAVLALARGEEVTPADVHNAWVAWMLEREPQHPALVPFDELGAEIAEQDRPFVNAIRSAARDL